MTNIVMLVYDRPRLTQQALESLYAHTPMDQFNLTLIDDGSNDFRTLGILQQYADKTNCTLLMIAKSEHVLARAKNVGVYWSELTFGRGDWLYLSDNDVYFTPGWLEKLTQVASSSESYGFRLWGGQVHPFHPPVRPPLLSVTGDSPVSVLNDHAMLDGPSWLMRWNTWNYLEGLKSSAPGVCQSEDVDFCNRVISNVGGIGVIHPFVVYHTGLTNSDGRDAPGRAEREAGMIQGVTYE